MGKKKKATFSGSVAQGAGLAAGVCAVLLIVMVVLPMVGITLITLFSGFGTTNTQSTGEPVFVMASLKAKGANTPLNGTVYLSSDLQTWEPVDASAGSLTSSNQYAMGSVIYLFAPISGYYTALFQTTVPQADTSKTTVSLGIFELIAVSSSMTVTAQTNAGSNLGTTASAWLNTTSGTTETVRVIIQNSDTDSGFGDDRWTDQTVTIGTSVTLPGYKNYPTDGYTYVGPFAVVQVNTSSVVVTGAMSSIHVGSNYYYFVALNVATLWNDADVAGDGIQVFSVDLTPTADAQVTVSIYDYVRADFIPTVSLGSADASTSFKVNV